VAIVGGGLFPRTALILRELVPDATLVIIDADHRHLAVARSILGCRGSIEFVHGRWSTDDRWVDTTALTGCDLIVIPLSFQGDRQALYARPAGAPLIVHDWIWRRRGAGVVVSVPLLKRLNLVTT
jgi:hypothetical protein